MRRWELEWVIKHAEGIGVCWRLGCDRAGGRGSSSPSRAMTFPLRSRAGPRTREVAFSEDGVDFRRGQRGFRYSGLWRRALWCRPYRARRMRWE